jgi:hypothetical protein
MTNQVVQIEAVWATNVTASTTKLAGTKLLGPTMDKFAQGSFSTATAVSPSDKVEIHLAPSFTILAAAKKAILGLLDARDFLGFQLGHVDGSISDEVFEELAQKYLKPADHSDAELATMTEALAELIREKIDSDVVAVAFNCDIEAAERALLVAARRIAQRDQLLIAAVSSDG